MVYIGLYVREHLNRLLNPETMLFFQHVFTIMGKSSVNGPLSIAMLNNQRVYIYIYILDQNHRATTTTTTMFSLCRGARVVGPQGLLVIYLAFWCIKME